MKVIRKGSRPGTTVKPNCVLYRDLLLTDLPGYGYIHGVSRRVNERVKNFIVHYIEQNSRRILVAVHVIDAKAFSQIVERWESRGEIPVDVEMYEFLDEVSNVIVVANKIDKTDDAGKAVEEISKKLGTDNILPASAKAGEVSVLKNELKKRLIEVGRQDLLGVFRA